MDTSRLRIALASLHEALDDRETLEPEVHEESRQVLQDLVRLFSATASDEESPPTSEGLRSMLLEFEAEHPKLARTIGQIADGLQNLGI
jgi:hypothetical protein